MAQRILLLHTNSAQGRLFCAMLANKGFDVCAVDSLPKLLAYIDTEKPDLLLVSGSEKGGLAESVIKTLRTKTQTLLIPVVVLSSSSSLENRERLLAAGAVDVIHSNCSEEFLCERVSDIVANNQTLAASIHTLEERYCVLVVEDNLSVQAIYRQILAGLNCDVIVANDGLEGWEKVRQQGQDIDLIISDLFMPRMNGNEFCMLVKNNVLYDSIPIIVVTTDSQEETLINLLNAGVTDYITKPFGEAQLRARLQAHLRNCYYRREQQQINNELVRLSASLEEKVRERTEQLQEAYVDTIYKLAIACDYKDSNTANHIARVRYYVKELSIRAGCTETVAEELGYSSMMHDVGKLGVPDSILLKPGPLSEHEWKIMRTHPKRGAELLGDNPFFRRAQEISLYHHEKYDGSGYPEGLRGREIPFSARVVAVVDVFDALTSERSYKPAWEIPEAIAELEKLKSNHLDPELVDLMIEIVMLGQTDYIRARWPCEMLD